MDWYDHFILAIIAITWGWLLSQLLISWTDLNKAKAKKAVADANLADIEARIRAFNNTITRESGKDK